MNETLDPEREGERVETVNLDEGNVPATEFLKKLASAGRVIVISGGEMFVAAMKGVGRIAFYPLKPGSRAK